MPARTLVDHRTRIASRRIGLMLPNWIGDTVMATPALRALRLHVGPDTHLVGIMNPTAAEVLAGSAFFEDVILYQRRIHRRSLLAVAAQVRRLRLESLILFPNSFSSALLAWLGRAGRRIGYARYGRGSLLTHSLAPPRRRGRLIPVSAVDYYLNLVRSIGCSLEETPRLELAVCPDDRMAADRLFNRLSIDASRPLITLSNGGGYGAAKKWPLRHVIGLAERLVAETEASVLFVCGARERAGAASIEQATTSHRIHTSAGVEPSIGLTKACVERSDVLVTTDSGIRHFAAAFETPCVTLFGPTDPRWSHNYHVGERQLRVDLACAPCGRRTCPLKHHRCLEDLSVNRAFEAVAACLNQRRDGPLPGFGAQRS